MLYELKMNDKTCQFLNATNTADITCNAVIAAKVPQRTHDIWFTRSGPLVDFTSASPHQTGTFSFSE